MIREAELAGDPVELSLLEHVSPIEWDNVVLHGQMCSTEAASVSGNENPRETRPRPACRGLLNPQFYIYLLGTLARARSGPQRNHAASDQDSVMGTASTRFKLVVAVIGFIIRLGCFGLRKLFGYLGCIQFSSAR